MAAAGIEIEAHNGGKQEIHIQTLNGDVRLSRSVLRPAILIKDEEGKTAFTLKGRPTAPLDEYLHIDKLPFKMTELMMSETAFMGQSQASYEMARCMMEREGYHATAEYIRQVTNYVGKQVFDRDTARALETEKNLANIPYSHDKEGVLYIMIDGAAINTRTKDGSGSSYRENKLVLIFTSNDIRTRANGINRDILRKDYTAFIGTVGEFGKYVLESAVRNGYGRLKETVILSDGAAWIRNMCDELFPDAVQILDFYHLAENIYSFSKYLHGEDPQKYRPWAEQMTGLAREGDTAALLCRLAPYQGKRDQPGVVNLYKYIFDNKDKIDYREYKARGYYIGSGPIESGNKTVLQRRCKRAGMRWDVRNAQYVLSLCARQESCGPKSAAHISWIAA
jgi:hypothetical protein